MALTKAEKQRYMTKSPVGTLQLTQDSGLTVVAVENGTEDYVITAFVDNSGQYSSMSKSKIDYSSGEPTFKKQRKTYKLSDFMKVGDRL